MENESIQTHTLTVPVKVIRELAFLTRNKAIKKLANQDPEIKTCLVKLDDILQDVVAKQLEIEPSNAKGLLNQHAFEEHKPPCSIDIAREFKDVTEYLNYLTSHTEKAIRKIKNIIAMFDKIKISEISADAMKTFVNVSRKKLDRILADLLNRKVMLSDLKDNWQDVRTRKHLLRIANMSKLDAGDEYK